MIGLLCRIYLAMLYAYPREFRLRYGTEMRQVFRDRCRDLARASSGSCAWFRFGLRSATDWIASAWRERRAARLKRPGRETSCRSGP